MENNKEDGLIETDEIILPSAPPPEEDDTSVSMHNLKNLKMTQIKADLVSLNSADTEQNEWTVVYSDSNSSVLSSESEEDEQNIDISVVNENVIERSENVEIVSSDSEEDDDDKPNLIGFRFDDQEISGVLDGELINQAGESGAENHFQLWEQSVDMATGSNWIKPIIVTAAYGEDQRTPSPAPSYADNDYESSDIDIINDEEVQEAEETANDDRDSILSMSISSVISQTSNLSLLREQYLQAHLKQSNMRRKFTYRFFTNHNSPSDEDEGPPNLPFEAVPLSKISRIRAYVHTPNTVLNNKLTLVLILSITAVVGLGIGHFIGWSNQWNQQRQLSMGQVIKLKQLQDDLLVCMKLQDQVDDETGFVHDHYKVCLRDFDYWKDRIETLFSENHGLIEVFQKTQKHFHENGDHQNVIGEHECTNKTTIEEFHNLKLDLLVNQMEHLKLLEVLEKVKSKGKQNEKRVKVLEEENLDLKKKLEEEEEDDQELELTWGNRVAELVNENEELRQTLEEDDVEDMKVLGELRSQMESVRRENGELKTIIEQLDRQMINGPTAESNFEADFLAEFDENNAAEYVARYNIMRERINQMMFENEELKGKIARYRWTVQKKEDDEHDERRHQEKMKALKSRIDVLNRQLQSEQIESRRWKEKFETIIKKMKMTHVENQKNQKDSKQTDENDRKSDFENANPKTKQQNKESEEEESPRKRKWNAFRAKMNKKFESFSTKSKQFFSGFVDKVKNRWNKLHKKYSKDLRNNIPLNGDKLVKIDVITFYK
ncbi:hypothetical protein TYRP_001660 [Tyrophagus putrescentiae]|nr:hypothetical protein TYRP_001660 [Tyrophagus putrescentiae]